MKIFEKVAYKILDEFKSSSFELKTLDGPHFGELEDEYARFFDEKNKSEKYWNFELTFNNEYKIQSSKVIKVEPSYKNHLEELCKTLFREISTEIDEVNNISTLNMLTDYLQMFIDLENNYMKAEATKSIADIKKVKESVCWLPLDYDRIESKYNHYRKGHLMVCLNSFYHSQVTTIEKIIEYLKQKIEIFNKESISTAHSHKKYTSKDSKKIDTLDRYQIALLFHYLEESGAINSNSYKKQAEIINQLTGISAQRLRTDALNKIWEIKSGRIGNHDMKKTNPAYALNGVNMLIKKIETMIKKDIQKNLDNQKNVTPCNPL